LHGLALAAGLLAATPGWALVPRDDASGAAETPAAPAEREHREVVAMAMPMALDIVTDGGSFGSSDLLGERRVTGAPYCADAINESVQVLADGNRIVHKTSTRLCRDSEGRTRQETEINGHTRVYITDPVAKRQWTLDPKEKTATPRRILDIAAFTKDFKDMADSKDWRDYAEQMRAWAHQFSERMRVQFSDGKAPPVPPAPPVPAVPAVPAVPPVPATPAAPAASAAAMALPKPVVITETQDSNGRTQREVRIYRMQPDADGSAPAGGKTRELITSYRLPAEHGPHIMLPPDMPPMPALPANIHISTGTLPFAMPRGQGVTTSLGQRDIDGVRANGERTTWTIEAGKIGNEKPIVISREKWTAPDLMLTLSTRDVDPRSGEVSYRLANLKRGEPDAALFKVPADYKVQENRVRMIDVAPK
jgi:hypothetical protein